MAQVFPFQAYRYTAKAGDPAKLVTQPYDKIPAELQQRYLEADPHNFVRLVKPLPRPGDNGTSNIYTRAAETLQSWIAEGVLAEDPEPGFYPYFQRFRHPESGLIRERKGFIGLMKLEEYERGVMHPHELTHSGPRQDRLELTRATRAHFGQLFTLYDDPQNAIDAMLDEAARERPLLEVELDGVSHRVWRITDRAKLEAIQAVMESKKLLMADGHHRYETALAYRRENPEVPGASRAMMTFVNMSAEGLVVLATHRILSGLSGFDAAKFRGRASERFLIEKLDSAEELKRRLGEAPASASAIGAVFAGDPAAYLLTAPRGVEADLDVAVLHQALLGEALGISKEDVRELKNIGYVRGFEAAVERVRGGGAQAAFLLRPVDVKQVAQVSFAGGVMPQKSTDFYPKLLAGLTTYRFG